MNLTIEGVILAGGSSQRMGAGMSKSHLLLGGTPLLAHLIQRLRPQIGRLLINLHEVDPASQAFGLPILLDQTPTRFGPIAGIVAALQGTSLAWVLTVPVDTPFLPDDLVKRLYASSVHTQQTTIATSLGRAHPTIALWPRAVLPDLLQWMELGGRSLQRFLATIPYHSVDFDPTLEGFDPFFNINMPEDLCQAEVMLLHRGESIDRMKNMNISISAHAAERMAERGVTEEEIHETIKSGESFIAKFGRVGFRRNWPVNSLWRGKIYSVKQVEALAIEENNSWVIITIIAKYF